MSECKFYRYWGADGSSFIRFLFPHGDEEASYASNALIEFVLQSVGDDRIAPHGMEVGNNYIDIPTAFFDAVLDSLEAA